MQFFMCEAYWIFFSGEVSFRCMVFYLFNTTETQERPGSMEKHVKVVFYGLLVLV